MAAVEYGGDVVCREGGEEEVEGFAHDGVDAWGLGVAVVVGGNGTIEAVVGDAFGVLDAAAVAGEVDQDDVVGLGLLD